MDFIELYRYTLVLLGIGLVIFVHEAGHFICARLCKVRVDVFSLGFGPRLLAWKRGATLYQIALVPLGGYVKMAGEENFGGEGHAPDDLMSKSVGQRFLIYSGGVIMNVVFGLVVFPIILMSGVPFSAPVIGDATPGGQAWQAEIPAGTEVLEINGERPISFDTIFGDVALSPGQTVRMKVLEPGASEPKQIELQAIYRKGYGVAVIDVEPALDPEGRLVITHDVARKAGIQPGDRLTAVRDGVPEYSLGLQLSRAMQAGETIGLTLDRGGKLLDVELTPELEVPKRAKPLLGIQLAFQRVSGLRSNPDLTALGLREGDYVLAVDDRTVAQVGDFTRGLLAAAPGAARVRVRRGPDIIELPLPALSRERAMALAADVALGVDESSTVVAVTPTGPAAAAGLVNGDRVMRIAGTTVNTWAEILELAKLHANKGEAVSVEVERSDANGPQRVPTLSVLPAPLERPVYGIALTPATHVYQASGPVEAVKIGMQSTWKFARDTWNTLKGIMLGEVSSEVLGGIITISAVSYSWAAVGLAKLFFFLCILSLNLAFINVLPIPVLDGGHLFFLLVEKLKGSPVSERVLGYSQMVGLVLIVSLMIYVTWNDIERWLLR